MYSATLYNGTSDSGPSEIGTHYNRPLYTKDTGQCPKFLFPIHVVLIHFEPPKEDNLSTKDTTAKFISSPKCALFGGSTVICKYLIDSLVNVSTLISLN